MTQAVPLYTVIIAMAAAALIYALYRIGRVIQDSARRTCARMHHMEAAVAAVTDGVEKLRASLALAGSILEDLRKSIPSEELRTHMVAIPHLLETVAKVGAAQLEVTQHQRAEAAERVRNPFGRPNAPTAPRDTEAANREHAIMEMMRGDGISREEAEMRLNPANATSVWEGDRFFAGWGTR